MTRIHQASLVAPHERYAASFIEALREGFHRGSQKPAAGDHVRAIEADFAAYLAAITDQTGDVTLPTGLSVPKVPFSLHWLIAGDTFIGEASFRHELNDWLRQEGGHVGYGIRPRWRGRGYGKLILALTIEEARRRGLGELLVTCDETNLASARIIEANGGVLGAVGAVPGRPVPVRRYRIAL